MLSSILIWTSSAFATVVILWIGVAVFLTDPYSPFSTVKNPFETSVQSDGQIVLKRSFSPKFHTSIFWRMTAFLRAGARIFLYRWIGEPKLEGSAEEIIAQIHAQRFQPNRPYVITGAHYSDLYVRNLGVFYNELLTPLPDHSVEDLNNRQRIAVQTVAFDLAFLEDQKKLVTTVVPLGGHHFSGINIYSEPSDSLHAVLFTLEKLRRQPATKKVAQELISQHRLALRAELQRYMTKIIDPETHVVKKDIHLASARDGVKRQGAFYDTVVAWKTVALADELEVIDWKTWPAELQFVRDQKALKQHIIEQYWQVDSGVFANDLEDKNFSADSLMAFSSGLLEPDLPEDAKMLEQISSYISSQKLDSPFPLKYSPTAEKNSLYLAVKVFAPAYMGESIWSHWGIEYVKVLLALSQATSISEERRCKYLEKAQKYLQSYEQNIEKFGGYPELYAGDGSEFKTFAVRGVLHTGWVVNYEATAQLLENKSCL